MGGYGSGRSGGRPTVEDSLTLNLPRLFKTGWLKPGARTSGMLRWSVVGTGAGRLSARRSWAPRRSADFISSIIIFSNLAMPFRFGRIIDWLQVNLASIVNYRCVDCPFAVP
jgi:hypothetical protein